MILCAGEALIDMLPRDTPAGEPAFAPYPGGAVFNTAVALARLGQDTAMFTGLSRDLFGDKLADHLRSNHVGDQFLAWSDRPTTLAFVTLVDGQARYAFYDENTAGRMLSVQDLPGDLGDVDALFFGGISLAVEPCADAYAALATREGAARVVMLDPNIRPGFIADEARYRARIDGMLAICDIVKVSDEDLHWLMGSGDIAELAQEVMARGPKIVCVTEGADGVQAFGKDHVVFEPARQVAVVDTVGAGDTFNAGFLASLAQAGQLKKSLIGTLSRAHLQAALSLGVRAAAVTVSRAGANPPRLEEL